MKDDGYKESLPPETDDGNNGEGAPSREEMMREAAKRMTMLQLHENVVREFLTEQKINRSEGCGLLYWLNEEETKMLEKVEAKFGCLVYHVVKSTANIGVNYSFLYVSKYRDEWEYDRADAKAGYPIAYVYNKTYPDNSELGAVGIKPRFGGLIRVS